MQSNLLFGLLFLVLSGVFGFFFVRQKKHAALLSGLKEKPISQAQPGDKAIFKGTLGGVPVKVPYSEQPVVYYKYELSEEVTVQKDGKEQKKWRKVKSGESKSPIELQADGKSLLINPNKFAMNAMEIHNGRAVGLNKDMIEALKFITQGESLFNRQNLVTKNLKLRLYGLPQGQQALVAAQIVDEGGTLVAQPLGGSVGFLPTHDTTQLIGKAKTMIWIFLGLAIASASIGVYGIISVISG